MRYSGSAPALSGLVFRGEIAAKCQISVGSNLKQNSAGPSQGAIKATKAKGLLGPQCPLTFLTATAGLDRSSLQFKRPQSDDAFRAPWQHPPGVRASNLDPSVFEENIQRFSQEAILAVYDE